MSHGSEWEDGYYVAREEWQGAMRDAGLQSYADPQEAESEIRWLREVAVRAIMRLGVTRQEAENRIRLSSMIEQATRENAQ